MYVFQNFINSDADFRKSVLDYKMSIKLFTLHVNCIFNTKPEIFAMKHCNKTINVGILTQSSN